MVPHNEADEVSNSVSRDCQNNIFKYSSGRRTRGPALSVALGCILTLSSLPGDEAQFGRQGKALPLELLVFSRCFLLDGFRSDISMASDVGTTRDCDLISDDAAAGDARFSGRRDYAGQ